MSIAFGLDAVPEALAYVGEGRALGKVVIEVAPNALSILSSASVPSSAAIAPESAVPTVGGITFNSATRC